MKYYFANLAVHLLVSLVLLILTVIYSNRNRRGRTKYAVSYFLPIALCAAAVAYTMKFTAPRLLDIPDVISANFYSYTGTIESRSSIRNTVMISGEEFYINPIWNIPGEGSEIRIKYTRYGHYVVEIADTETVNVSDSISEEMQSTMAASESTEETAG